MWCVVEGGHILGDYERGEIVTCVSLCIRVCGVVTKTSRDEVVWVKDAIAIPGPSDAQYPDVVQCA